MDLPRLWRLRHQLSRMEGTSCPRCKTVHFPPRAVCGACGNADLEPRRLGATGRLYSFTGGAAPKAGQQAATPTFGLVELDEGGRVFAQLTDLGPEEPQIGQPVQLVIRRLGFGEERGPTVYAYKFRPIRASAAMEHVA
jgi:uncharacterized OB-fold protein